MLAHLKRIVVRSLLNWSIISTAAEQKNTTSTQGTRTEHGEAGCRSLPWETSTPCRHRTPRAPAAAGARANLQTTRESSGCGEGDRTTQLVAQRILISGSRRYRCSGSGGGRSRGVRLRRQASPGGWLRRRRDTRGRRGVPPPAQQRASTQVHSERSMCSNLQQTRGTKVASDERRGTTALPEGTSAGRTAAAASILRHGGDLVVAWWGRLRLLWRGLGSA